MRLNITEISLIKEAVSIKLVDYKLMLFGSRVDDSKKGGDIDLLLLTKEKLSMKDKMQIEIELMKRLGERKIDLVNYSYEEENAFKDVILQEAVEL